MVECYSKPGFVVRQYRSPNAAKRDLVKQALESQWHPVICGIYVVSILQTLSSPWHIR